MREQRIRLKSRLKVKIDESFAEAYELPVIAATRETGLEEGAFPPASPCGFSQAMDAHFWPE
jgi:hypothetical protein